MTILSKIAKSLSLLLLFLMITGTSQAVSSDTFSDSVFTDEAWSWTLEPATWSVNNARGDYLVVQSQLNSNPGYSSFNSDNSNYLYQLLDGDGYGNYTIQLDASKMGLNYETVSLVIAEDDENLYAVNVKHDYGNRRINVMRYISGSRTELHSGTSYLLTSTYNLQLKIQIYDDNGIKKMNVYAIPDSGEVNTLISGRVVEFSEFNTVGIVFSRGTSSGQSTSHVSKFVYNDFDPDIYQIPAGAIVYNPTHNTIYINDYHTDLHEIYYAVKQLYDESFVHNNILQEVSPGVWKLVSRLEFKDDSKLYLNSSTCTELRVCYSSENYMSLEGNIEAQDVKILGWLNSEDKERDFSNGLPYYMFYDTKMDNVTFEKNGKISIGSSIPSVIIQDPVIKDLVIKNYRMGLIIRASNATIDGIYMHGAAGDNNRLTSRGIYGSYFINSIVKNVTVYNPHLWTGSPFDDATGLYGFQASGTNNYYENIHVNGSAYSGYATGGTYNYYKNLTAMNTHHNAIEVHDKNSIIDGVYIAKNTIHGLFSSHAPDQSNPDGVNNTFRNITIYHRGNGNSAIRGYMTNNFTYENLYIDLLGGGNGYQGDHCIGTTISNASIVNPGSAGTHYPIMWTYLATSGPSYSSYGNTVENSYLEGSICLRSSSDNRIVNTDLTSVVDDNSGWDSEYTVLYPLDIRVLNEEGQALENVAVTASTNPSTTKGLEESSSTFYTDSTGKIQDKLYAPYISKHVDSSYCYYTLNVFSSKGEKEVSISDISSDSTWYREDPNVPAYTITAIIPDSSAGPHITGFAPSEENLFTAGETKKFRVWADEELTTMKWYVNGNLRSGGSMEYNWEVEEGSHTIMFTGSNANGSVLQTWEITEGVQTPVEGSEDPVLSGDTTTFTPSTSSLTADIGESTTFSISSEQPFTSLNWYLDGELVESGTMDHTQEWTTAGTHLIRLEGDTGLDVITRTWYVVVSEAASSTISISPSSTVVAPGETFSLDIYIDPNTPLSGSQFDMHYSTLASVSSVQEGGLFSSGGMSTSFDDGEVDSLASILRGVCSTIVGSGTISTAGPMATVNMIAGSSTGMLELALSDVVLSDAYSNPAPYTISNATVLVDSAPEFGPVSAVSATEGDLIILPVNATDPDGDGLIYSCISLPQGASFDTETAVLSWSTAEGDAGSYELAFRVTDGYLNDSVNVTITIEDMPVAPGEPGTSGDGSTFTPSATSFTADFGESTVFTVNYGHSFISCDWYLDGELVESSTTVHTQEWASSGTHTVKFLGAAEAGVVSRTWDVVVSEPVTPPNNAPVITLFEPANGSVFTEGSNVNVRVQADDEDDQELIYTISIDDLPVSSSSSYEWCLDYSSAGSHTIEVVVSDGTDSVTSTHTVSVTNLFPSWDINEDGIVNDLDIALIGDNFGKVYTDDLPRWDVNKDGSVNVQDLSIVAAHFGEVAE